MVVVVVSPVQGNGSEQRGLLSAQRSTREGKIHLQGVMVGGGGGGGGVCMYAIMVCQVNRLSGENGRLKINNNNRNTNHTTPHHNTRVILWNGGAVKGIHYQGWRGNAVGAGRVFHLGDKG